MKEDKLLSFAIPTKNHSQMLDEALSHYYNVLQMGEYDLTISDNCSVDDTENIVRKYQKEHKNLYYYKQVNDLGIDENIQFLQNLNQAEYCILLGDGVRFYPERLQEIIEILKTKKIDVVCFDYENRTKGLFPSQILSNREEHNELLASVGWYLTQMSSYVLSKRIIEETKQFCINYQGSEFNYFQRLFIGLAKINGKAQWLYGDYIYFSQLKKGSTWIYRKSRVYFTEYTNTILSLPSYYTIESKVKCIKEAGKYPMFGWWTMLNDIINGIVTENDIEANFTGLKLLMGRKAYLYSYITRCPRIVQRALRKLTKIIS